MVIERTENEVVIRLLPSVDTDDLQSLINLFRFKEITSQYKTEQSVVDSLASEINKNLYKSNRKITF
jgi:hypothetical protein